MTHLDAAYSVYYDQLRKCNTAPLTSGKILGYVVPAALHRLSPLSVLMHTVAADVFKATRMDETGEVTLLLQRWREGEPGALQDLMPLVYTQLHSIAKGYMQRERHDHTLQPTALINEVFLRLVNQRKITWYDRVHFYVFAAKLMRNILKDHARAHLAERRGGVGSLRVPLSEEIAWIGTTPEQILDLSRVLDKLEVLDARKAQIIELRFFLALQMEEVAEAEVLSVSLATAERDLKFARSWLHKELGGSGPAQAVT